MAGKMWLGSGMQWGRVARSSGLPVAGRDGQPATGDAVWAVPMRSGGGADIRGGMAGWLANAGAVEAASLTAAERIGRLSRTGIPAQPPAGSGQANAGIRSFGAAVLGLEAIEVREHGPMRFGIRRSLEPAHPLYAAIERAAVKSAYALGLDMAFVEAAADDAGRVWVRSCSPADTSAMDERDAALWGQALARAAAAYAAACRGGRKLLIGADPEFILLRQDGKVASAARYFPPRGETGCDTVRIGGRLRHPIAELRPAPAAETARLLGRLRGLLRAADAAAAPGLRWLAGAMPVPGLPLGGHIHLSGAPVTSRLLRALDSIAALPFALAADPRGDRRRPRYGALGDFRRQPHGGFEYRTLPSWLVSPVAAAGAAALTQLAAREAYGRLPPVLPAERESVKAAFYAGDRSALRAVLDELHGMMAATDSYTDLGRFIDPFLDAVRSGRTWDESADFRPKWGIAANISVHERKRTAAAERS